MSLRYQIYLIFFIGFSLLTNVHVHASSRVQFYTMDQGLSNNSVTCVLQDSRGFIWLGTEDGLNRFDGSQFKVYRHKPNDSLSISGNFIQCIEEDGNGDIWVGTKNSGLNKWRRFSDTFQRFFSQDSLSNFIPENEIYGITYDCDSCLWIKTPNYLVKREKNSNEFDRFGHFSNVFIKERLNSYPILATKYDSLVWVGSKDGLRLFNRSQGYFTRLEISHSPFSLLKKEISSLVKVNDSIILAGTTSGLYKINRNIGTISEVKTLSGSYMIITSLLYNDIEVWVGTSKGLRIYKNGLLQKPNLKLLKSEQKLLDNEITDIIQDRSGLYWLGTKNKGLIKLDVNGHKFDQISLESDTNNSFETYDFTSVYVDDQKNIFLGTNGNGIYILNKSLNNNEHIKINSAHNLSENCIISAICKDKEENIWYGTNRGVYIQKKGATFPVEFDYLKEKEIERLLQDNYITDILEDQFGNIWFASHFGLYVYDKKKIVRFFKDDSEFTSLCSDDINCLFEDSRGYIWIGTSLGINIYSPLTKKVVSISNSDERNKKLSNNYVLSIAEDKNKIIWIGTRSGLSHYNLETSETGFNLNGGDVFSDLIYGVLVDDENGVWVSSSSGVSYIDSLGSIYTYNEKDGVAGKIFNSNACYSASDGELFFGGVNGLSSINPETLIKNQHQPNVVITSIDVFHKGRLDKSITGEKESIELKYENNSRIKIEYSALDFTSSEQNKYQLFLEGFDDVWGEVTSYTSVNYSDLPAGEYVLKIRAANSDLVWNNEPVELKIKIVPPLWMTNFAYAFYLIAIIFIGQSVINYRIRGYRKAYKSLQEKATDKKHIELQREELSIINKSLTDSINYAKRIQEAIIPSEEVVRKKIPNSFVYFRPKDIVSGDFYWIHEKKNKIYIAAVDCTGHGVPGAFMSIIGYDLLRNIVGLPNIESPSEIMDILSRDVKAMFRRNSNSENSNLEVSDGMDMAMCVIDIENQELQFCGAFNPIYIIRDNEILEQKGDRFAIGHEAGESNMLFTTKVFPLVENDTIYMFSDGYADQFGGPEGKKFKYRRFRHLLLNIHKLPLRDQKIILHQKMEEWMRDYEQVDDMVIIGFRPNANS